MSSQPQTHQPQLSSLASKPPQPPSSSNPESSPISPTSSNASHPSPSNPESISTQPTTNSTNDPAHPDPTPASHIASWRPNMDRHQSWNEQDMKRKFQERLLSPRDGKDKDGGFTSEGEGKGGKGK